MKYQNEKENKESKDSVLGAKHKNLEPPCIYGALFDYNFNSNPPSNFLKQLFLRG